METIIVVAFSLTVIVIAILLYMLQVKADKRPLVKTDLQIHHLQPNDVVIVSVDKAGYHPEQLDKIVEVINAVEKRVVDQLGFSVPFIVKPTNITMEIMRGKNDTI